MRKTATLCQPANRVHQERVQSEAKVVDLESIIEGREKAAKAVGLFGSKYAPIFERMNMEVRKRQQLEQRIAEIIGDAPAKHHGDHQTP